MKLPRLLITLSFLLFVLGAFAISLGGPSWNVATPFTNDTLICTWTNTTDTLAQNITLLKNNAYYNSTYQNASLQNITNTLTLSPSLTTKGDKWTCRVTLYNGTASVMQDTNVTILNSPPTTEGLPAGIFNANNIDVGYLVQVTEDQSTLIDVNATDADGDTLTYLPGDAFCTRTSSSLGTYTCTPTQSDLVGNLPTLLNITYTVTDGQNVGGRTITFNITPSNDPPTTVLINKTTPVNQSLNYTFTVSDEETNTPFSFSVSAPLEIANKVSVTSLNGAGTSASFYYDGAMPDFNDVGLWNISINITDTSTTANGSNNSASNVYTFTLNITGVGRPPYFTNITPSGLYTVAQGSLLQINISANDPDANSTLTFLATTSRFTVSTVKADTNSSDARGQINFTPSNADVGVYNVTLTVRDTSLLTNTTTLQFNVTNINDAPTINQISLSASNTLNNRNASNLTGYSSALFIYDVNGTDPDTIYGDSLNYSDNTSLFDINSTTGRIMFTPTDLDIGSYLINITAVDSGGLQASRILNLTISPNTPPFFNATLPQLNCTTNALCSLNLGLFTKDNDIGDSIAAYNLSFIGSNISTFAYNSTTGLISFTTVKTDMGNYTLNVSITDTHGSSNWSIMNISINNTPEAPVLTRYNFTGNTIVETHAFTYELQATDNDFILSSANEQVNFTTNLSLNYTITPLSPVNTTAYALLSFTPGIGESGNYTINITARDSYGLSSTKVITFEVYPRVPPPNITTITPWGLGSNYSIQTTYANTTDSQFTNNIATINMDENTTVLFNFTVNSTRPLTYNWSINGTAVASTHAYTKAFDFFSAGYYVIAVNITDDRFESTVWTWGVTVNNKNRLPQLVTNLTTPLTVNGTITYSDYFTLSNGTKFFDPDDDTNSNGIIDGNETNTLTFSTLSTCDVATISTSGANLVIKGTVVGSCTVAFNATDLSGAVLESNLVGINVTEISEGTSPVVTTTSSSGGGGSSSSSTFVPLNKKLETPKAFNLIAPRLVTVYSNKTVKIPIVVNNTWNGPLKLLSLSVQSNVTKVKTSFDTDFFEEIPVNESREVTLTITNYRAGENYELTVVGNVTDPAYKDTALILLNSIEQSNDGSDVNVKVTFANDLITNHPECQELNEVLTQAKQKIADGDIDRGSELVDSVINGCKYLVSTQQRIQEKPSALHPVITINDLSVKAIMLGVLAFIVLSSIAFIIYYHYTHKPEDDI